MGVDPWHLAVQSDGRVICWRSHREQLYLTSVFFSSDVPADTQKDLSKDSNGNRPVKDLDHVAKGFAPYMWARWWHLEERPDLVRSYTVYRGTGKCSSVHPKMPLPVAHVISRYKGADTRVFTRVLENHAVSNKELTFRHVLYKYQPSLL